VDQNTHLNIFNNYIIALQVELPSSPREFFPAPDRASYVTTISNPGIHHSAKHQELQWAIVAVHLT